MFCNDACSNENDSICLCNILQYFFENQNKVLSNELLILLPNWIFLKVMCWNDSSCTSYVLLQFQMFYKALSSLMVGFMFSAQSFFFVFQTHQTALKTFHAYTKKGKLCSARGTEDETLILGTLQCCGEFERETETSYFIYHNVFLINNLIWLVSTVK